MSNPIQIRNTIIGTGRPKICIPLVDETLEGLERSAAALCAFPCDLVEWRADFFEKEADPVCRKEALSLLRELLPGTPLLFYDPHKGRRRHVSKRPGGICPRDP